MAKRKPKPAGYYFDNAIGWAQFRLAGGWTNTLSVLAGTAFILPGAIIFFFELGRQTHSTINVLSVWSHGLLALQALLVLIMGAQKIAVAIRKDISTRQIESHRMMPLGARHAIAGYLMGTTLQVVCLMSVIFVVGCVTCAMARISVVCWTRANLVLLSFGIMLWAIGALSAFVQRGIFWVIVVVAVCSGISGGALFSVLPGLLLLCSPMMGNTIFVLTQPPSLVDDLVVISMAAQFLVVALCIGGAARKYTRDDALAWPIPYALIILLMWSALSVFGIYFWTEISPRLNNIDVPATLPIIGTIVASVVISMVVMASTAWSRLAIEQSERGGDDWYFPVFVGSVSLCLLMIIAFVGLMQTVVTFAGCLLVAIVCGIALVQVYLQMLLFYPKRRRANLLITPIVLALWLFPLLMDAAYYSLIYQGSEPGVTKFAYGSMIACLMEIYHPTSGSFPRAMFLGIAFQAGVAIFFAFLLAMRRVRRPVLAPDLTPLTAAGLAGSSTAI
ncbi:MAG: hypothetical protein M3O30_13455 [Planctomycetota bacterium]|nr:hypothetical protein [Planctomycetota bacterium]